MINLQSVQSYRPSEVMPASHANNNQYLNRYGIYNNNKNTNASFDNQDNRNNSHHLRSKNTPPRQSEEDKNASKKFWLMMACTKEDVLRPQTADA